MSKIAIKGNESGTATFTIEAPATNTDRIFELPDEAGKVLTDASDIEPQVKTATNASGAAPIYACRAWVNFDGTTSPGTIRASGNVSSVTKNNTGRYTVNFSTAMPDANFSAVVGGYLNTGDGGGASQPSIRRQAFTTTSVGVRNSTATGSFEDGELASVQVFR